MGLALMSSYSHLARCGDVDCLKIFWKTYLNGDLPLPKSTSKPVSLFAESNLMILMALWIHPYRSRYSAREKWLATVFPDGFLFFSPISKSRIPYIPIQIVTTLYL